MKSGVTGDLHNWRIFKNWGGRIIATGLVYNDVHKRFDDGDDIYTSTVIDGPDENMVIYTENSLYRLVGPGKDER